jgi:hypothetical protein
MPDNNLDFMEKRLESFAQTQQALLLENRQAIRADNEQFKSDIQNTIEAQIKVTVNGKIDKIAQHLQDQDVTMGKLMVLLEDKKFLQQLWSFFKFLGGLLVFALTAWGLFNKIK